MVELSNGTLSILVVVAVVAIVAGTLLTQHGPTGYATTDTGYVNLTINQTLAIQVDPTNNTINFGACVPYGGQSYWCATNDSIVCDNNGFGNCSGDTASPQFIRIDNVGNVDANITVQSECNASSFIGGTAPAFQFISSQCNGTGVSSWTDFSSAGGVNVCTNLSYLGGQLRLYANVTIPSNAVGGSGGCLAQSDLTFSAVSSP